MFIGEYNHNLDSKGRIIIPAKFRDELSDNFFLTKGFDGCLTIYSTEQWQKLLNEIAKFPTTRRNARDYVRTLTGSAWECVVDNQGRIQIPSKLLKLAGMTKECSIVGVNDHVEIWDKETWENYYSNASNNFEEVAEDLDELLHG